MDLLFQLNSFTVFLAIAAVGFLFSDDVAVFGGIFEALTRASTTTSIMAGRGFSARG